MKRVILLPFIFFISGILIYYKVNYILIGAVVTALFFMLFIKKFKNMFVYCLIFLLVGICASAINTYTNNNRIKKLSLMNEYEGRIIEREGNVYTLENIRLRYKIKFSVYDKIIILPGDYIKVKGKVQKKPDYKMRIMNIYGTNAWITCTPGSFYIKRSNNVAALPYKAKYKITSALRRIDIQGGSFISGLICGYTSDISADDQENFKKLGISHILAVSGFNLAIIYYFLTLMLKKINYKKRIPLSIFVCFIYTLIGGFEPSILRAFIMITVASIAGITGRLYDVLNSLIITAFLMLSYNTLYIFNIGFLLSFTAASGIILFSKDIMDKIPDKLKRIKDEISVTLGAFISTLPLVLWYNGFFSPFSILRNIIIAPFVSILTVLGFISAIIYIITSINIVLYPVTLCGILFIKIIQLFSKASLLVFTGKPIIICVILYYLLLFINFNYITIKISKKKILYINIIFAIIVFSTFIYKNPDLKVHFINVGQGDSILLETPSGKCILVDTGPEFGDYAALRDKVIPYMNKLGYNKIDMLIVSHFHKDHAGGLQYLLKNYNIEYLLTFEAPEQYKEMFSKISEGDKIHIDGINIDVLYPDGNEAEKNKENENEVGLVLQIEYKNFKMLLTADADKKVMDSISGYFDVLKVPHHGSIGSLGEKMLCNSEISTAVISVGKNSFGHPSPVVINELEKSGIKVYRTDLSGDVVIDTDGSKYKVHTEAE